MKAAKQEELKIKEAGVASAAVVVTKVEDAVTPKKQLDEEDKVEGEEEQNSSSTPNEANGSFPGDDENGLPKEA